jgi:6-pyruvoyltetrahydropterin/6-carboxytetrahydropterin synthase
MELTKTFRFEASHVLPKHPGKCSRLHGHSWVLHVSVSGPINRDTGFVMDFADISAVVQPLIARLDHRHLGTWEVPADLNTHTFIPVMYGWSVLNLPRNFYPTSENLLVWIGLQLSASTLAWSTLSIEETCTSRATLTRKEYDNAT